MAKHLGKKVLIIGENHRHKGNTGYVLYEDRDAITIEAPDLIGTDAWFGMWYARKEDVEIVE